MTDDANIFTLEYWVDPTAFSKNELEDRVKQALGKFINDISFDVSNHSGKYLILRIKSTERIVDACHDKLKFKRESAFRSKDELGNKLRSDAFPILAEIEVHLRNFINQVLFDVMGFNWWSNFFSQNIRDRVGNIENKVGKSQTEIHNPIEFTYFEDLMKIITNEFQTWTDERTLTVSDLSELLTSCNTIEDIQTEIDNRRNTISLWDDAFSNYFEDKESWRQLKEKIEKHVISVRNKVMHHRLIRKYELTKLEEIRDEVIHVIELAKPQLSEAESVKTLQAVEIARTSMLEIAKAASGPSMSDLATVLGPAMSDLAKAASGPSMSDLATVLGPAMLDLAKAASGPSMSDLATAEMIYDPTKVDSIDINNAQEEE